MTKPATFLPPRALTKSFLAITTAVVVVLSSMQFSAVAAVDSAPKVILDVENTSQSTYVTNRIRDLIVVGDKLFFVRDHASDDYGTAELWVSDGTEAGTNFLVQIQHYDDKNNTSDHFAAVGELLYFFQPFETTSDVIRYELWTSNGTELGTVKVTEIVPDLGDYFDPRRLKATSSRIFLTNNAGSNEIWTSDGTSEGTGRAEGPTTNLDVTAVVGETLFFAGSDKGLWKTTDGTVSGTQRIEAPPTAGDGVKQLKVAGDWIYFAFESARVEADFEIRKNLWRTNGTSGTATRLTDFNASANDLTRVGDQLFFEEGSTKLWSTDGTAQDLIIDSQVRKIGNFEELTAAGDSLFFTGEETITGELRTELWFSGGSSDTSSRVYSETTVGNDVLDYGLAAVGDKIFFTTGEGDSLFSSDGTTTTEVVVDNQDDNMYELTSAGGILYFVSYDSTWQRPRLWSFNLNTQAPPRGDSYSSPELTIASPRSKVVRFADFSGNSSILSKKARAGLTKAIKKFTAVNAVVCTGYTSGVRANASQRKLALDRARAACKIAKKLAPDAVVKLQAAAAKGTGPKFRAVRVKITGN